MIAYNHSSLDNRFMCGQASEAHAATCINTEEYNGILSRYPTDLYTPNVFIRVGLFFLTAIVILFASGLLYLITSSALSAVPLLIGMGLLCYISCEFIIRSKKHYRSGVDNALLYFALLYIYGGLMFTQMEYAPGTTRLIILLLSLYGALRFADLVITLVAYGSLFSLVLFALADSGEPHLTHVFFILMILSAGLWFTSDALAKNKATRNYRYCLYLVKILALVSFYLAGNYYSVHEWFFSFTGVGYNAQISAGWVFWLLTLIIPPLYLVYGIRRKERSFLWTGMVSTVFSILTIRYYHHIMPIEWTMVLAGSLLTILAAWLLHYFRSPRHGFTREVAGNEAALQALSRIESLAIAQTFPPSTPPPASDFNFGGGSGGGGGAGGSY